MGRITGYIIVLLCQVCTALAQLAKLNIIYILADVGHCDVSCLNEASKIHAPNIDKLAAEGMSFTDAHSAAAVCTPTRYGILTGTPGGRN